MKIYFPQYKKGREGIEIVIDKTILDYAREIGVEIASECGGFGKCGRCIVRVERGKGNLNEKTENEKKFSLNQVEAAFGYPICINTFSIFLKGLKLL